MGETFIEAQNLSKVYGVKGRGVIGGKRKIRAVDNVTFRIARGEIYGLVGESGSGKSTLGRLIVGMEPPTSGKVYVEGRDLYSLPSREFREVRRRLQVVFQNPDSSLDPRMRIRDTLAEALEVAGEEADDERIGELLASVGLEREVADSYPHQLSGGMKQRVAIARALAADPKFILLDEPTSALDVSVQAQILNLLLDIQSARNLTYLFISHNLAVVYYLSDRIGVMYLGDIVEEGGSEEVYREPLHPYTKALIYSMPDLYKVKGNIKVERVELAGEPPSPIDPPRGCKLHPRCPHAMDRCSREAPKLIDVGGRRVACWLYE